MGDDRRELERIRGSYEGRAARAGAAYSCFDPAYLLALQQRERLLLAALARHGFRDLSGARVLDVGCGTGDVLRRFVEYGARPHRLHGIDLLPGRVAEAARLAPQINFVCGSAGDLPYPDASFDLVTQFTAFSSVVDGALKARMAAELRRVLHPEGLILWYDFWLNPTNRDVKGIGAAEVRRLFRGCRCQLRRLTLAPPLARPLARHSPLLCHLLERIPFLLSHYLAVIEPERRP